MKILDANKSGFPAEFAAILKERAGFKLEIEAKVKAIFSALEKHGGQALLDFCKKFDGSQAKPGQLKVSRGEINDAEKTLSRAQRQAIKFAAKRIRAFHSRQIPTGYRIAKKGSFLQERWLALECVGLYIPGGQAPLASTVLMTAIPAKLAGVKKMVMATPAGKDGKIHPAILYAANLCKITEIYKMGGAHAIAAMALGAGPIPKVEKIVGPGGGWVSAAKVYAQGRGLCGIDTLAGPSEIVILADGSVPMEFAVADLSAQLEHGEGGWAFLISTSSQYLEKVRAGLKLSGKKLFFIKSKNAREMVELANRIAPEHLELQVKNPDRLLPELTGPAAIYVGAYSPIAAGDYIAGPNHCLPTGGRAAFDSPLGVWDFMKRQSVVKLSRETMKELGKPAAVFAELEGLVEHSRSLKIRIGK